ncbi:MAG TPA: hypothetical protein VNF47_21070 [Streptosporangiaceae bacterium]|nr:hypothetical protein [Streptosporangiaceae bacterium]
MKYDELRKTILASSPQDWAKVEGGDPFFLSAPEDHHKGDGQHWTETRSHVHMATYRADVDLRIAWGLPVAEGLAFEGMLFPDKSIERRLVDGLWRGALVTRWTVLLVDGGRMYLPEPGREGVQSGEMPGEGYEHIAWTAKASEIALARLINGLANPWAAEFDHYLEKRAAIIEIPDE